MQSIGTSLRYGSRAACRRIIPPHEVASTSRALFFAPRRHASFRSPLGWIRETLAPNIREKNTKEEIEAARKEQAEKGQLSVFESVPTIVEEKGEAVTPAWQQKEYTHHKYSTANFKISHRKLNMLGRQLSGKPIDSAILQMMFSEKRASKRIKSMLVVAKSHAIKLKGLDEKKLVVAESWVTKGPNVLKRVDIKGRGRYGVKKHPHSRLHVVLKEGKTRAELYQEERARKLKRIVSAGLVREDVPLRNPGPAWAW